MNAMVLEGLNLPLQFKKVADPIPGKGEVLVQVKSAALNHRDVWIQKGQYASIKYPIILGSDAAGIVTQLGEGVDKKWLKKEVIINPGQNWGANKKAQSKEFKILGLPDNGTFAEYVKIPAEYLIPKPKNLSWDEAAALPQGGVTAYRALFTRAKLEKGEKILVTGIGGGVALFAMQFAIAFGAKTFVTSKSDEKISKAVALGAIGGANYTKADWMQTVQSKSGGFDAILDSASGENFAKLLELATAGGRITFYGGTRGNIKDIAPSRIFWKQLSIMGTTMGTQEEFAAMIKFVEDKKIKPIIDHVFDLKDAESAMKKMERGEQFGKIILRVS